MSLKPCPILINGNWSVPETAETSPVHNPSTGEVIAEVPHCGADVVDAAVNAAADAFEGWWQTPPIGRVRVLMRYCALLEENFESLAAMIVVEHGKTITEARGDLRRGIEVAEYACGITDMLKGEVLENVARGIDCSMVRQPIGVCVGICPYNFPALVPMWMYPMAIACGNSFILKPSEKVPLTGIRLIELFEEAGLPPGVFSVVHGGKECVDALLEHPKVAAISFVGSSAVAEQIHRKGTANGKRVQAAGGAKNFVVVMPDADVGQAVEGLTDAAFGCSGQRCMAGSTAVTVGAAADTFIPAIVDSARSLPVGPTHQSTTAKLGGMTTAAQRDRVAGLIQAGVDEGCDLLVDGRGVKVEEFPNGFYLGASVLDRVQEGMRVFDEEVFGPVLNVMRMDDVETAIEMAGRVAYGNGACIYTQNGRIAREFRHRVKAGMVGVNVGVPAPLAYFPFSGWDYSFFGDLHLQGRESVMFYTRAKVFTERWFAPGEGDVWHKDD
ncbi:MAG: methylmalonate-semialdehyde dehydrogenase (CoA acylating) [Verrucomicrobiales bacterium]|nr:methylmalonate-semialdehyde dehydrogenase (CoA acylating) [Verrucomicrobiales bacterium]